MTDITPRREDLVSRKAAAKLLGIHPNTLDRAAAAAGLKKHRVLGDNQVFYLREGIAGINVVEEIDE